MNSAVAAVTLGPIVHRNVYGRSRVTGLEKVFCVPAMMGRVLAALSDYMHKIKLNRINYRPIVDLPQFVDVVTLSPH